MLLVIWLFLQDLPWPEESTTMTRPTEGSDALQMEPEINEHLQELLADFHQYGIPGIDLSNDSSRVPTPEQEGSAG